MRKIKKEEKFEIKKDGKFTIGDINGDIYSEGFKVTIYHIKEADRTKYTSKMPNEGVVFEGGSMPDKDGKYYFFKDSKIKRCEISVAVGDLVIVITEYDRPGTEPTIRIEGTIVYG